MNVSHHLGVMWTAGVEDRRDGRFVLYKLLEVEKQGAAVTGRGSGWPTC